MNIYSFLVSPDIAAHCEAIGHIFSPLEMAIIIGVSEKTLLEKHAAWREIIAKHHDMPICGNCNFKPQASLHDYLRKLIALEEAVLNDFLTPGEGEVYHSWASRIDCMGRPGGRDRCFSTFQDAWEHHGVGLDWIADKITYAEYTKDVIDSGRSVSATVNSSGKILSVFSHNSDRHDYMSDITQLAFYLPIPFETGDIVEYYHGRLGVIRSISNDPEVGDSSDMLVSCYSFDEGGKLFDDSFPSSLHTLRYYKGELRGQERFLRHLSKYIKEDDDNIAWLIHVLGKITASTELERPTLYVDYRNE